MNTPDVDSTFSQGKQSAIRLFETGLFALGRYLSDERRIKGRRRSFAAGGPKALGDHAFHDHLGVQRYLGLGQDLGGGVQRRHLPLGLRSGLLIGSFRYLPRFYVAGGGRGFFKFVILLLVEYRRLLAPRAFLASLLSLEGGNGIAPCKNGRALRLGRAGFRGGFLTLGHGLFSCVHESRYMDIEPCK